MSALYALSDNHAFDGIFPTLEWIVADTLMLPEYQRRLNLPWCKTIANNFDPDKLRPLDISRRADGDYVMDGQQRLYAIRVLMHWGDQNIPCWVYRGLTMQQEVKFFTLQTSKGRKPITILDDLHANWVAKDPVACAVVLVVHRARLKMDWETGPDDGKVRAAATLINLYKSHGSARLLEVLSLLRDTLGSHPRVFQTTMLMGMAGFLVRYTDDPHYSRSEFVRKVGRAGLEEVLQRSRGVAQMLRQSGGGASDNIGQAMFQIYNHGRSTNRLGDWPKIAPRPKK